MSWEKTHIIKTEAVQKSQIWKVWSDVDHWHHWDTDIEFAKLVGPFAAGSTFKLKSKSGPAVKIRLLKVEPLSAFTDVTTFPLAKMYGIHEMRETADGLEITHTVRIEGPLSFLWKKLVAEKVAAGIEEQTQKMLEVARNV